MKSLLCLFAAVAAVHAADLKTLDGTTYKDFSVLKVDPDGLRVAHKDGVVKIMMENLPADVAAGYKFDPVKAKEFREKKAAEKAKAAEPPPAPATPADSDKGAKPKEMPIKPAAADAAKKQEADPQGWENIPADPAKAQKGKTWGIAEVQAAMHRLDGQIIRVEILANSASTMESIDKDSLRMFAGTIFKKDSNYEFIGFPVAAEPKMKTMLRSTTGKMLFWVRVEAENQWPFPQLWVVGRTLQEGGLGQKPFFKW